MKLLLKRRISTCQQKHHQLSNTTPKNFCRKAFYVHLHELYGYFFFHSSFFSRTFGMVENKNQTKIHSVRIELFITRLIPLDSKNNNWIQTFQTNLKSWTNFSSLFSIFLSLCISIFLCPDFVRKKNQTPRCDKVGKGKSTSSKSFPP